MVDKTERPLQITETRESDFDRELHVSVFDYLADAYLAGRLSLDEVVLSYHEAEGIEAGADGRSD
jgi:hypothetical protein